MSQDPRALPKIGSIEVIAGELLDLLDPQTPIEVVAAGFAWTEGPAWDRRRGQLYFSDIPENRIHIWHPDKGLTTFLDPAGRESADGNEYAMPGTNGLFMSAGDTLLVCNQDARSVDRINLSDKSREVVAADFCGGLFNSPNDVISSSSGRVYFTDPPFGLKQREPYVGMELDFHGVYHVDDTGHVTADVKDMRFPNGLVFTPDEKHLYVSQSDKDAQVIKRFSVDAAGALTGGEVFYDAVDYSRAGSPGLPDGMTIDVHGNLFATVAGGVAILTPQGKLLGRIATGKATANCTFGEDGRTLFMTAHDTLLRVRMKTKGFGFS